MIDSYKLICVSLMMLVLTACGGADERKAAYMERGTALYEEGNYEKARLEFKNAIQIDPKDADAHFQLGRTLELLGEWRPAMSQFLAVVQLEENHTEAHIHIGKIYLLGNATDRALEEVETALQTEPNNADALALRGTIRARSEDISGAFADGTEALKQHEGHVNSIALLSSLHLHNKEDEKALALIDQGLEKNPRNLILVTLKAKIKLTQKDLESTGKLLQEIIDIEPNNMGHWAQLASFYVSQNKLDEAEKLLRDATATLQGEDAQQAQLLLIEFLAKYRDQQSAEDELLSEIKKKPEDYSLQFALAQMYLADDQDKAIQIYEQVIEANPYGAPAGLEAKNKLALIYLREENITEASKLAEEILKENPQDQQALTIRGSVALFNKDASMAIDDFRAVLDSNPNSARHLRMLAHAHNINGDIILVREALEKAVEAAPTDLTLRSELTEVLLKTNQPDRAIEQIQQVIAIDPDNVAALETLFKVQSAQKDWESALVTAEKMKKALPESGEGHHLSGLVNQMQNDFSSSVDDYTKALELSPNAVQPLTQLVRGYMAQDQADEALERVNKVLERSPENHIALGMKGEILLAQKRSIEAREVFRLGIETKADYRPLYIGLAKTYLDEKNVTEVIAVYEAGVEAIPKDPVLITSLASIYERTGKPAKAATLYEKVMESEPTNQLMANNLAMLYVDTLGTDEAIEKALKLTRILGETKNPAYLDTIGWVYHKAGKHKEAIELLRRSVKQSPKQPLLQYHLGMAYYAEGSSKTLAKGHLETAINSGRDFVGKDEAKKVLRTLR